MYKNVIQVEVFTTGGANILFDDASDPGAGQSAYASLTSGTAIIANGVIGDAQTSVLVTVPYASVDHAIINIAREEAEDPTDPTCV